MEFDRDLDVRGLDCPLPILRSKRSLATMEVGEVLRVRATDPHAVVDFAAFCEKTAHRLERQSEGAGEFHFWVRKG
ncbi:sulfurtransferase TusA family protein [Alkalilimnicola sp. S0819]|nr:sulfurtransferase TusA family protein [Alkalilimnicola sp. S0819]MPQ16277.1 preprotein translocase subunit TatC [Alkalilimnicola sp. S0819]